MANPSPFHHADLRADSLEPAVPHQIQQRTVRRPHRATSERYTGISGTAGRSITGGIRNLSGDLSNAMLPMLFERRMRFCSLCLSHGRSSSACRVCSYPGMLLGAGYFRGS